MRRERHASDRWIARPSARDVVPPLLVWAVVLAVAVASGLQADRSGRQALAERFDDRAAMAADFVTGHVADLLARERVQATRLMSGATVDAGAFSRTVQALDASTAVLLDRHGRLLHVAPPNPSLIGRDMTTYPHLRTAVREGRVAVSPVVPSAARKEPVVGLAVPYDTPAGRRVFSTGIDVQRRTLGDYLRHAVPLASSLVVLIDGSDTLIAADDARMLSARTIEGAAPDLASALRTETTGHYTSGGERWYFTSHPVRTTPWRLVTAAPVDVVYAPAAVSKSHTRWLLAALASIGLAVVAGAARARAHRRALRESEERFRTLFRDAPIGMAVATVEAGWVDVNPALCTMLGRSEQELLEGSFRLVTHPDDIDADLEMVGRLRRGQTRTEQWDKRYVRPDGEVLWGVVSVSAVDDRAGRPRFLLSQVLDVTERRRREEMRDAELAREREQVDRLRELDRMKDEFVALVSHELRTPLTSITGYVELLQDDADVVEPTHRRFIDTIDRNTRRLNRLVGDLLDLFRLDAGKLELRRDPVDLAVLVEEAVEAVEPAAARNGVELRTAIAHEVRLAGDATRLAQVVDNLLSNAVKYTPAGGVVTVTVGRAGDRAHLDVSDTGIGIPAGERRHLFERFFRSSTAVGAAIPGTGLGLAVSKAIVDAHDGTIAATPGDRGGTVFSVELPAIADVVTVP